MARKKAEKSKIEAIRPEKEAIMAPLPVPRTPTGQFPVGVSGNPAGRPKGSKNRIVQLRQDLEVALREHVNVDAVKGIIDVMVAQALEGDVSAAKMILDKVLPNARDADEESGQAPTIKVVIENATFGRVADVAAVTPIEGEFTEVAT
jgi:Family of unknown function (DUF5681)